MDFIIKRTLFQESAALRSKRLFDVAGAIGGLIAFSQVMALIAAAILVEDGRPILAPIHFAGDFGTPFAEPDVHAPDPHQE
jgi:lipopolysaccharide/colanic/teichoic acid biosynthesis glycosyltransferase